MKTQAAVNEFLQDRRARNLSPVTINWYGDKLQRLATRHPQLPEDPGTLQNDVGNIPGTPETKHAHFRAYRALYNYISERYETRNPMLKLRPPRCPKKVMATLEPEEAMALLSSASNLRDRTILTLLIDTGIRTSELAGLRRHDIKTHTIRVRGKSGEREVPISDETRRLLLTLIGEDGKDDYVFHGDSGVLSRYGVYRIVRACMTKAGIHGPKLGAHRIRHGFGKGYLVNGGDALSLQQLMGHTNMTTTQQYASLNLNDTIAKHHMFTPLRAAHAAAQASLFEASDAVREAEEILVKEERR